MTVEKNDVNIAQLFKWGKVFKVEDEDGNEVSSVHIRLVGDADLNKSRVYALRESAKLRNSLKQTDSDERLAFILEKDGMDKEKLLSVIIVLSNRELVQRAYREVKVQYPSEPKSTASLEAFEKYQKEVDEYPDKRAKAITKFVEKEIKDLVKRIQNKTEDELYRIYEQYAINELCEERMIRSFREACVYYGCYKDDKFKELFFDSLDDFRNLEPSLKEEFINAYQSLEIPTEELKKLRVVTQ